MGSYYYSCWYFNLGRNQVFPEIQKSETVKEAYVPLEPAHVIAFRELEKLKNEELWQKGEIKRYYTILTDILRQYLGKQIQSVLT